MNLFDVYPLFDIEPVRAAGAYLWDRQGQRYLDLYGGHAVISIGHGHPHYRKRIGEQLERIGFYSNSVQIPLQRELAAKLGELSGYPDYALFLCNSGAEANENALKLASFHNGRKRLVAFHHAFHGRTSAALTVTDNPAIRAPLNASDAVTFLPLNDAAALEKALAGEDVCAVIVEGIQGIGGIYVPDPSFLREARALCDRYGAVLILDEIQSGYGRSGQFFAHQHAGIAPDLITVAKGMGNGFPVAGVLIHPRFQAAPGLLGTTFGGSHLACAAALAVLEVIEQEGLIAHAAAMGQYLRDGLAALQPRLREVRGTGLMLGIDLGRPAAEVRRKLLFQEHIFTGSATDKQVIRLLPPLNIAEEDLDRFLEALEKVLD